MLQTSQRVANSVQMIKSLFISSSCLPLSEIHLSGTEGETHVCVNSFWSQLNHLKGVEGTSECKWERSEHKTKEDERTRSAALCALAVTQSCKVKLHRKTGHFWSINATPDLALYPKPFDLLIKLRVAPILCRRKQSREHCPSLGLFIRRHLCPFSCCVLNYVLNVFAYLVHE